MRTPLHPSTSKEEPMKTIYLVHAEAAVTKAAKDAHELGDTAEAIIFVDAQSEEQSINLARSVLLDYGYQLTTVTEVSVPSPSVVRGYHPQLILQYNAALIRGHGFEIAVLPRNPRHPDHPAEIRSLDTPVIDKTKKHLAIHSQPYRLRRVLASICANHSGAGLFLTPSRS